LRDKQGRKGAATARERLAPAAKQLRFLKRLKIVSCYEIGDVIRNLNDIRAYRLSSRIKESRLSEHGISDQRLQPILRDQIFPRRSDKIQHQAGIVHGIDLCIRQKGHQQVDVASVLERQQLTPADLLNTLPEARQRVFLRRYPELAEPHSGQNAPPQAP
jgi:hypothetical protein